MIDKILYVETDKSEDDEKGGTQMKKMLSLLLALVLALSLVGCGGTTQPDSTSTTADSPLAGKKKLEKLWIRKNPISDLSPLRSNENLIYLRVKLFDSDQCLVTDWTPVEHVETVVGRPE